MMDGWIDRWTDKPIPSIPTALSRPRDPEDTFASFVVTADPEDNVC